MNEEEKSSNTLNQIYSPAAENIHKIIQILKEEYPQARSTSLEHRNAFELLIATILAAQSTDKLVNKVTKDLFKKYKSPYEFANAKVEELEQDIKSTGFYRNKARSIISCCKTIVENFGGIVPQNIEDLTSLPGVGRKTANVVLGNIFGKQAIIVDTHMRRIAKRLGLTVNDDPTKIEFDLMKIVPQEEWTDFSHKIVALGRTICLAKKPKCSICRLLPYCKYGQENA